MFWDAGDDDIVTRVSGLNESLSWLSNFALGDLTGVFFFFYFSVKIQKWTNIVNQMWRDSSVEAK